jgi:O-methyltransferase
VILALPAHLAFVLRGLGNTRASIGPRLKLAGLCVIVHLRLECGHNPKEALYIVDEIIELPSDVPGVVVECGTYLGGSTAKLSYAVAIAGRELIVCDSFEGLPEVRSSNHTDTKADFKKGEYLGRLEEVKSNVARFGKIQCVRFVPGWYEESLNQLTDIPIVCGFWDVDLKESFTTCIKALWANLRPGSKVFLHDIDRAPVVDVFTNPTWWRKELGIDPPQIVGAYSGLSRLSPLIGYVIKAED